METLYPNLILDALRNVRYPGNGKNIVELGMVADDIRIDGNKVSFTLEFERPTDPFMKSLVKAAEASLHTYISPEIVATITPAAQNQSAQPAEKPLAGVQDIIGVSYDNGGEC